MSGRNLTDDELANLLAKPMPSAEQKLLTRLGILHSDAVHQDVRDAIQSAMDKLCAHTGLKAAEKVTNTSLADLQAMLKMVTDKKN